MKKTLMFLALATIGLASCNGGFKKSDGGMLYEIHTDKDGPRIQDGDFISVNVIAKTDGDSVLFSTYESGHAVPAMVHPSFKGDVFSGIEKLTEGDSATIKVNADSMFKKGQPKPPGFKGNYLVYVVKVDKVIAKGKLSDQVFQGRITDYMKTVSANIMAAEPGKIKKYIDHEKLAVTQTPDSLEYVIIQHGTGQKIAPNDTAVVNYTGRLLNGKIFDSSIKDTVDKALKLPKPVIQNSPMRQYKAIHIPVGQKRVIPGWDEGLQLLSKGDKAIFIIPSKLAYGERGAGNIIPPYSPIVFEIEMVDIVKPNPNAPKPKAMVFPPPPSRAPVKK